jgi:hypothetical protein
MSVQHPSTPEPSRDASRSESGRASIPALGILVVVGGAMTGTFIVAPTVRRPERAPESTSSAPSSEKGRLGKRVVPKSENLTRDFHEAIRPDSRNAPTATSRTAGIAFSWGTQSFSRKDYDKAADHFSTVIRFDPENALAYHYRGIAWAKKEYDRAIADYNEAVRLVRPSGCCEGPFPLGERAW